MRYLVRYLVIFLFCLGISVQTGQGVVSASLRGPESSSKKTPTKYRTPTKSVTRSSTRTAVKTQTPTVTKSATITSSSTVTQTETNSPTQTPSETSTQTKTPTPTYTITSTKTATPTATPNTGIQITVFDGVSITPGGKLSSQYYSVKDYSLLTMYLKATNKMGISHMGSTTASCYFAPSGYQNSDRYKGEYPRVTSSELEPYQAYTSEIIGPFLICEVTNSVGGSDDVYLTLYFKPRK